MNYIIISSHPYGGSFNAGVVDVFREHAISMGHNVDIIDLVADGFNPVMSSNDLKLWIDGKSDNELVNKYRDKIKNSDILVFCFPIWWGYPPAVLKGFCDKVLLKDFAFKYGSHGEMIGLLTDKKSIIISTMETPVDIFNGVLKNPVENAFIKNTLETCGITTLSYMQIDKIVSGGREYAQKKMDEIKNLIHTNP